MNSDVANLARRWFEEVWNARSDDVIDELMAHDAIGHMEGGDVHGPDEFRKTRAVFLSGLPDLHITVEDVISEGHQAVCPVACSCYSLRRPFGRAANSSQGRFPRNVMGYCS